MAKNAKVKRNKKTKSTYNTDYVFSTVADLEVGSVPIGSSCVLLGYYEPGDFGQPIILISETEDSGVHSYRFRDGGYANLYQDGPLNVLWYGAYKDGTNATTTTAAIQEAIDEAGAYFHEGREQWVDGKTVFLPAGDYVTNDTLLIERGVTLQGELNHPGGVKVWDEANHATKIRPSTTVIALRCKSNVTIEKLVIQHSTTEYGITDYNDLSDMTNNGTAIGSRDDDSFNATEGHGYGCCIRDCIIAGFNWAIDFKHTNLGGGRYRLENLLIDCWNGVILEGTGDVCRLRDVHLWPLLTSAQYPNSSIDERVIERGGKGIVIKRGGDWAQLSGCFTFGYQIGFELDDANLASLVQCAVDGSSIHNEEIRSNPVYGVNIINTTKHTMINGMQTGGHPGGGFIAYRINMSDPDTTANYVQAQSTIVVSNAISTGFDDETKVQIDNARYVSFNNCLFPSADKTFHITADMDLQLIATNILIPTHPSQAVIYNDASYSTNTVIWQNNVVNGSGTFQVN